MLFSLNSFEHDFVQGDPETNHKDESTETMVDDSVKLEHGNTRWNAKVSFSRKVLLELINNPKCVRFCREENVSRELLSRLNCLKVEKILM